MEDERSLAEKDFILKKLVAECEFEGDVYSSDEELDLPYESNDISDDIEEIVFREQIRGAKKFFQEVTEFDDDDLSDLADEVLEVGSIPSEENIVLKPSVRYSDALSYFETAMERNSKMRDALLTFKQALLKKKQEYEDRISALESIDDDVVSEPAEAEVEEVVSWGFPGFLSGIVFTNKSRVFPSKFAPPYFKDRQKFYCPPNSDAVAQDNLPYLRVSKIEPNNHWSPQSIDNLENAIKKSLIEEFKSRADFKAIYQWRDYSSFVKQHSLSEVLSYKPQNFKLDWLKIATLFPEDDSRSYSECSKLWDLYLSPEFSKEEWTPAEDEMIIFLAKKYDEKDWDLVAEELDSHRSPFQVFSYYQASLRNRVHFGEKWTLEEDEYLRNVIGGCTYGNFICWKKVMYYFEKRTYIQVYNRWQNNLAGKKKGKFSFREDRALIAALAHGMCYKDTVKALGGQRTTQQIRSRLMGIVKFGRDNALNIGDWSAKEDSLLIELVNKYGENYSSIAKDMVTRDRTQCRHRYLRLKKLLENPDFDIRFIERRKKRTRYCKKIRSKKRSLMKMLGSDRMTLRRKRKFIHEVADILDEENIKYAEIDESYVNPSMALRCKPILKQLADSGSGFWTSFDHTKASFSEMQLIIDCCHVLDSKFNYNRSSCSLHEDEHLRPVEGLFKYFRDNQICPKKLSHPPSGLSDCPPSRLWHHPTSEPWDHPESVLSDCQAGRPSSPAMPSTSSAGTLSLLPPNFYTCSGFLNALSFCRRKEVKLRKRRRISTVDTEEVKKAKDLFQQRLLQLFLWPAILSNKSQKNKLNRYGNRAVKFKLPENFVASSSSFMTD